MGDKFFTDECKHLQNVGVMLFLLLPKMVSIYTQSTTKIVSVFDQEIPQSQTADKPMAPKGRATEQSRDIRKTNQAK